MKKEITIKITEEMTTLTVVIPETEKQKEQKPYFIEGRGVFVPIINKVVTLYDSFDGKEVKWEKAVKAGAPTRDDWYIILYFKKEINRLLVENGGEAIRDDFYWSSTEHSQGSAWVVGFTSGGVYYHVKCYAYYVRAVSEF